MDAEHDDHATTILYVKDSPIDTTQNSNESAPNKFRLNILLYLNNHWTNSKIYLQEVFSVRSSPI